MNLLKNPRYLFAVLFLFILITGSKAQQLNTAKLDSLFTMLNNTQKSMCTFAVSQHGKLVYSKTIGFRDSTSKGKLYPDEHTVYRIGSVTKTFTAVLIIQLIEEGKLSYTTKLAAFFPEFTYAGTVTIEQMLNHHSGLPRYDRSSALVTLMGAKTKEDMVKIAAKQPFMPEDTVKGHYSNLNYMLLGFIIEKLSGTSFNDQLKSRITSKLNLIDTYNLPDLISADKNQAHSFKIINRRWTEDYEDHYNFTDASGQIVSTAADLNIFINALFAGSLVSKENLAKMILMKDKFGMGLMNAPFYEKKGFGHTGRIDGFVSALSYLPEDEIAVAMIINGQVYPMNDILIGALSIIYNKPYEIPNLQTIVLSDTDLTKFVGTYVCKEVPMKVIIKKKPGFLQVQLKQKGALFKQVITADPISNTRFMNNSQGIILDFTVKTDNTVKALNMKISGAKLNFEKIP